MREGEGLAPDAERGFVEACRAGGLPAFEELYRLQGARMKSVAMNLLGNRQDAEDAVQEAFLKVYRSLSRFKGESGLGTWIYRILVNTCHDLGRKRGRRREEPDPEEMDRPTTAAVDHPLRVSIERALGRLHPRQRAVFILFEIEGFKHREIAEILGIPEGTSKNSLFEAKRELQAILRALRSPERPS